LLTAVRFLYLIPPVSVSAAAAHKSQTLNRKDQTAEARGAWGFGPSQAETAMDNEPWIALAKLRAVGVCPTSAKTIRSASAICHPISSALSRICHLLLMIISRHPILAF